MKIIIITLPDFFHGETDLVNSLFKAGMERLHLRKPKADKNMQEEWLQQIEPSFRQRIVVHDFHELAREYALGGIHLNGRNPNPPSWVDEEKSKRSFTISRSCHSISELSQHMSDVDYMFLSPIFNSISKEGYGAAFSREELSEAKKYDLLNAKVYALGGVSLDKFPELESFGFSGATILGDLWMSHNPLTRIKEYQRS